MEVRRFEPHDAEKVSQLIIENLRRVLIQDYSAQGIKALLPNFTPAKIIEDAACQLTLVGILEGNLIGTASLMQDRVRSVFVDVGQHRTGVGRVLMTALEAHARQQQLTKLYLMASLSAAGFYEKLGYRVVQRVERDINGVPVPVIHMEKLLVAN